MDYQAVQCIADADTSRLGIADYRFALLEVALLVEIGVDDTRTSLYHRHLRVLVDSRYQPLTAPRNQQVHIAYGLHQDLCRLMVVWQQLYGLRVKSRLAYRLLYQLDEDYVALVRILAALQNHGIPAPERYRRHVDRDVRPRLVDDTDDTYRDSDSVYLKPVRTHPAVYQFPDRRRELADCPRVRRNPGYALRRQLQPVIPVVALVHAPQVDDIRRYYAVDVLLQLVRYGLQRRRRLLCRDARHLACRSLSLLE